MIIYVLVINLAESLIFHLFGNFESFSLEQMQQAVKTQEDVLVFWTGINSSDKIAILRLAALDLAFIFIFSYITMFWGLFVVVEEKSPLNAFKESIKSVSKDPLNTFGIFLSGICVFICIFGLNILLGSNALGQLLFLILTTYTVVYFILMTFLYFERYR